MIVNITDNVYSYIRRYGSIVCTFIATYIMYLSAVVQMFTQDYSLN